jgi:hypothetical protein
MQNDFLPTALAIIGLAVLAVVGLNIGNTEQQNAQIVRPDPNGPPAPVVPQLPQLIAYLKMAKAQCENHATEAMRMRRVRLADGQRLYNATRADFDGAIAYMQAAMVRRFDKSDPAQINQWLRAASAAMQDFLAWPNQRAEANPPVAGAGPDPLAIAADMALDWYKMVEAENAQAIAWLRQDLESCRLRDWNQLGR